jgi:DNA polymerase
VAITLDEIAEQIRACKRCRLHEGRKNAVPGEGLAEKGIMLVGEAPGEKEDEEGRPFVGPAGKQLTKALEKLGINRAKDAFITNVVKCRPPGNREPLDDEVEACLPYLLAQIKAVRPKVIVALGAHSAKALLSAAGRRIEKLSEARGRCYAATIAGVSTTICVTYHPAATLYNPRLRDAFENDLAKFLGRRDEGLLKYL